MIGIINFGLGNLGSIINVFEKIAFKAKILEKPTEIKDCSHLVLPGVGSFRLGMENLMKHGWDKEICKHTEQKKPLMGICLGMQLLFEYGEEDGGSKGLGLIKGKVLKIKSKNNQKIPIIGWNRINFTGEHFIFKDLKEHVDYYFLHSYECILENKENLLAHSDNITACVSNNKNIFGTQFHPEKSPPSGNIILKNFSEWNYK